MGKPTSVGPKDPSRILERATSVSAGTTQSSRSVDPLLKARIRKPYQDDLNFEAVDGPLGSFAQRLGLEPQLPGVQQTHEDVHVHSSLAPNDASAFQRIIRKNLSVTLADGTKVHWKGGNGGLSSEMVSNILRTINAKASALDDSDLKTPKRLAKHVIGIAPLPHYRHFDISTYFLSRDYHSNKNISALKVPLLYNGYDIVEHPTARVALFAIADKCQSLDSCMVELFKAFIPNLPKDFVAQLLSSAKAMIVESDPSQPSTRDASLPEEPSSRPTYLGDLGHHLESILKGESRDFIIHRVGEKRLNYLQDALELPYWSLIVDLFEAASTAKQASGMSQTIMENAVAGCYQFIKSHLQHLENLYTNVEISEDKPTRILEGVALRLRVLEQYTQAVDPLRRMEAIFSMESCKKPNEIEITTPVPETGDQVLTFSILFIVLAIAMVPAMIGFAKAVQDGETGSTSDADFNIVIRDTIMTILGATLSAVQLFRWPRKTSAYKMAWVFSGLAISLGVTAIIVYPLVNKAYSSLCGFFAQFFSVASLVILVLEGPASRGKGALHSRTEKGGPSIMSKEKKTR